LCCYYDNVEQNQNCGLFTVWNWQSAAVLINKITMRQGHGNTFRWYKLIINYFLLSAAIVFNTFQIRWHKMCDMGDNSLKYSNYFLPSHASIVKYNHLSQNSQTSYFNGLHNFGFHTYFFLKMRWAQITTNRILYFES
jgi:hypothetical protein